MRTPIGLLALSLVWLAACADRSVPAAGNVTPSANAPATPAVPPVVDGWREYPLRDGVISITPAKWRTDTVDVSVPAGKGLEVQADDEEG